MSVNPSATLMVQPLGSKNTFLGLLKYPEDTWIKIFAFLSTGYGLDCGKDIQIKTNIFSCHLWLFDKQKCLFILAFISSTGQNGWQREQQKWHAGNRNSTVALLHMGCTLTPASYTYALTSLCFFSELPQVKTLLSEMFQLPLS